MNFSEIVQIAAGQILRIKSDGKFLAGHGAKYCGMATASTAKLIVKGVEYWIQIERLERLA